ncbi:monovalent cation/H+ antiporter subunit D [Poseidonocella sedimentorum]|uniref:Multisubunit potassium/proton antiporter, PhaD subunit n=1 Tax=Poseidonocella sedimentorum TaxID=871652 RepID=A0A1I6CTT9_9RHOB|nr:monovalent cation/H+ antiporter subunit D [Poseidonocella sedimentorum]SFQ96542.1 multisubunit potassium/proton antiporter, PhaD subunit [Poseidonocella sedimentorum]
MNHWIIAPVVLPALMAPLIAFVMRHDALLARSASFAATVSLVAICTGLMVIAGDGAVHVYKLGDWPAPFGIVLVLDRLSAVMILLTSVLALITLTYAVASGWDQHGRHFHALFQFQLMGICGAFLTGDAFNLFVFFEVLLIASYGLMIHSGGRKRLGAGLQYVIMNLAGSTLFLFALGTIYATTGTLNIADLAVKVREIPLEEAALLRVAAILLLMVFAVKAAIFPVQFWLPGTYTHAPAPVAALFAIMTKVGAYAILRFYTVIFAPDVAAVGSLISDWLLPAAIVTAFIGALGVLGTRRLTPLIAYSVVASMGTLMIGIAAFSPAAASAALYYLVHSTFAAAALFLLADLIVLRRGPARDALAPAPAFPQSGLLAALFFAGAIGMAGMPPLSGFLGKLLILDGVAGHPWQAGLWFTILASSLLLIVGFARAGSLLFWSRPDAEAEGEDTAPTEDDAPPPSLPAWSIASVVICLAMMALLSGFAGPASRFLEATTGDLFDPSAYISAVLETGPEG